MPRMVWTTSAVLGLVMIVVGVGLVIDGHVLFGFLVLFARAIWSGLQIGYRTLRTRSGKRKQLSK
jgi:hypothetical protein